MAFTDKSMTCVDCGATFVFTARDQEFHASKGFANEPKRCFNCRQQRRVQRGDAPNGAPTGAGAPAGGSRPQQRQPVYTGPRATGATARPGDRDRRGGAGGGRPRSGGGRRDFDRGGRGDGGNAAMDQRSFDGSSSAPVSYAAPCAVCGNDTPVSANAGTQVVLCPDCYSKMTALASS